MLLFSRVSVRWLSVAPILIALSSAIVSGQSAKPAPAGKKAATQRAVFRTAWGQPDLQGTWANSTITPLERPAEFAGKEFLTAEEAVSLEKQTVERGDAGQAVALETVRLDGVLAPLQKRPGAGAGFVVLEGIMIRQGEGRMEIALIGADGANSLVRSALVASRF